MAPKSSSSPLSTAPEPHMEVSDAVFHLAADHLRSKKIKLTDKQQLELYSLFKQATVGACNTSKPGMLDFVGKAKWDAWSKLGEMTCADARKGYCALVDGFSPNWRAEAAGEDAYGNGRGGGGGQQAPSASKGDGEEDDDDLFDDSDEEGASSGGGDGGGFMAPSVSTLMLSDEGGKGSRKDLCHFASEGDAEMVLKLLGEGVEPHFADEDGETGLHFAADGGHLNVISLLLEKGVPVDIKSSDGQTSLHYACAAENIEVCRLLLKAGADPNAEDDDGSKPSDATSSDEIKVLLEAAKK